jgi:hypothetical protein
MRLAVGSFVIRPIRPCFLCVEVVWQMCALLVVVVAPSYELQGPWFLLLVAAAMMSVELRKVIKNNVGVVEKIVELSTLVS